MSEEKNERDYFSSVAPLKEPRAAFAEMNWWQKTVEIVKRFPVLCVFIVAINVLITIVLLFCGVNVFTANGVDYIKLGANYAPLTLTGDWWRIITSNFIHTGLLHMIMNMIVLLLFGFFVELICGKRRFLSVYFFSALYSGLFSLAFHPYTPSLGASGAVFGINGLLLSLLLLNSNGRDSEKSFSGKERKDMLKGVGLFLFYNLIYGFSKSNIGVAAHLGGLISGFLIGTCYVLIARFSPKEKVAVWNNGLELSCLLLFIYLLGDMTKNIPEDYYRIQRLWEAGFLERYMEYEKKRNKKATGRTVPTVDFTVGIRCGIVPSCQKATAQILLSSEKPVRLS